MASYATVRQIQRRPVDAIEWARKAIAEAEHCLGDAKEAEAAAYYILDWAHVALGREDEAIYGERALEIYRQTGNKKRIGAVLNHLAMRSYLGGRWDDCLALADQARRYTTPSATAGPPPPSGTTSARCSLTRVGTTRPSRRPRVDVGLE